jgi:hypothetical protein
MKSTGTISKVGRHFQPRNVPSNNRLANEDEFRDSHIDSVAYHRAKAREEMTDLDSEEWQEVIEKYGDVSKSVYQKILTTGGRHGNRHG